MVSNQTGYVESDIVVMPNIVGVLHSSCRGAGSWHARLATDDDATFLFKLFCDVRESDFQAFDAATAEQLLTMQFNAQSAANGAAFPDAVCVIVETPDGTAIGRLLYVEMDSALHIVDVALLASHRNRGIGSAILAILQQVAADKSIPVTLSVARHNPAMALYRRLGFMENGGDEVYCSMSARRINYEMEKLHHG